MHREKKMQIFAILVVLGVFNLSCVFIQAPAHEVIIFLPNILCAATGGTWVSTAEFNQGKCDHSKNPSNESPIDIQDGKKCQDQGGSWIISQEKCVSPSGQEIPLSSEDQKHPDAPLAPIPLNEEGEDAVAVPQIEPLPEGENNSIPSGTYVGTTDLPAYWDNITEGYWPGVATVNEITIIVASDGTITGSMNMTRIGEISAPIQGCSSAIHIYTSGILSGQFTDINGTIEFQMTQTKEIWRNGCPSGTDVQTETGNVQTEVFISGNQITGTIPDYFSFEATKR